MAASPQPLPQPRIGFCSLGVCVDDQLCGTLSLEDKMYSGAVISADLRSLNLEVMTLGTEKKNPHKPVRMFCLTISSFLHVTPRLPSLFSLVLPFPEGPSLNPRESGRSQGWRGRAGNPRSDPGQFNYPVFFRCTTRVPISQPTPLMRPGLASLTFNDLPIDALGPPHTGTQTHIFFFFF